MRAPPPANNNDGGEWHSSPRRKSSPRSVGWSTRAALSPLSPRTPLDNGNHTVLSSIGWLQRLQLAVAELSSKLNSGGISGKSGRGWLGTDAAAPAPLAPAGHSTRDVSHMGRAESSTARVVVAASHAWDQVRQPRRTPWRYEANAVQHLIAVGRELLSVRQRNIDPSSINDVASGSRGGSRRSRSEREALLCTIDGVLGRVGSVLVQVAIASKVEEDVLAAAEFLFDLGEGE